MIVLTGDDSYQLKNELQKITSSFKKKHGDFNIEKLDASEKTKDQLLDAALGTSLFAENKLVIVRSAGENKDFLESAPTWVERVPAETQLVLIEPKLDKRAKYYKQLSKIAELREFKTSKNQNLRSWVMDFAKQCGGEISASDAVFLLNYAGENQLKLENEIQKLIAYEPKITKANIELLAVPSPSSTIFQLLDAAFSGQTKKALEIYEDQRAQKVEPFHIIGMIAWQLHILALIKTAKSRSDSEIAKQAKMSPFVVGKSRRMASGITLVELRKLVARVAELDARLKSESLDADEGVRLLILEMKTAQSFA